MFAVSPRSGLPRKSGTMDMPDNYTKQMVIWRESILRQGTQELQAYRDLQEVDLHIKMLDGKGFWPENRPIWRSSFFDNYLADVRRETLSSLSQIRPALDISSKIDAYKHQGKVAHDYLRYLWSEYDLDLVIAEWLDHALFGSGILKVVATTDEWMFAPLGLDSVIPVQCDGDLQTSAAVVFRSYKQIPYFQNKFGADKCVGLEREAVQLTSSLGHEKYQRPSDIPEYRWSALSPRFKRRIIMKQRPQEASTVGPLPFPVVELQEIYWDDWSINETDHDVLVKHPDLDISEHNYHYIVPPNCRMFPRKRLTIFAGNRVMYDGPSPFWHGEYPFTMLQLNPCVWSPGGISKYRDLIPLVRAVNRIGSGVDESVVHALNRCLVGKRGTISQEVWDAIIPGKPGQKMLMNPTYQKGDLSWLDPPLVPQYVEQFLRYLVDVIKRRSGSLDVQGLAKKKQVPGGEAIEQMRDTMSGPFQMEERYLQAAIKRAGRQCVSNIFQYATLSNRLRVLGADGETWEDFDYNAGTMVPASAPREDHWKLFGVNILPGSGHGNAKQQKKVEALTMYRMGALSMSGLYRQTEFPENPDQIKQELAAEHQVGLGPTAPKGAGRTPRQTREQRQG